MERNYQTTLKDRELPEEWKLNHTGKVTKHEGNGRSLRKMTYFSEAYYSENHNGKSTVATVNGNGELTICAEQRTLHQSISYSMASARKRLVEWIEEPDNIPVATMREEDKQIAERKEV